MKFTIHDVRTARRIYLSFIAENVEEAEENVDRGTRKSDIKKIYL